MEVYIDNLYVINDSSCKEVSGSTLESQVYIISISMNTFTIGGIHDIGVFLDQSTMSKSEGFIICQGSLMKGGTINL